MFFRRRAGHKYIVKADQQSYDFTHADLTTDYTLRDLDLSSIIPKGTVLVHLWISFKTDTANSEARFSTTGYTGVYLKHMFFQSVVTVGIGNDVWIPVGADRKISYKASNVNYAYFNINIVGWLIK